MSLATRRHLFYVLGPVRALYVMVMDQLKWRFGINLLRVVAWPLSTVAMSAGLFEILEYRSLNQTQVLALCQHTDLNLKADEVRAAYARGDVCVAAMDHGTIASYTWTARHTVPHEHGVWVSFDKNARYIYKSFTRETYRGRRIVSRVIAELSNLCPTEDNIEYALACIDVQNLPSNRAFVRLGARTVGYAGYLRWFGRTFIFHSRGAKRHKFYFYVPQKR